MLKNKVAIVTGGGQGIGRAIALRFAREGADVVVAGRTLEKVEVTAKDIEEIGSRSLALKADVSVASDVARMVKAAVDKFGRIDILVNNAGIVIRKNFFDYPEEYTEEDWNKTMDINLKGVFLCCKEVVPVMLKQRKGKIVNISSMSGLSGDRGGAYGPSKAGVINLTASMALELAPYKINVNVICPGAIETPMSAPATATPEKTERMLRCIPYGRIGQPEDIASAALFLASDESDYMVGSVVIVDGGMMTTFCCY